MGDVPTSRGIIADRLTWLIENRHPSGTGPSTYEEIARRSRRLPHMNKGAADGGAEKGISTQTVLNIASGAVKNPGVNTVRALARVFRVRVSYLLGETDELTIEPLPDGPDVATASLRSGGRDQAGVAAAATSADTIARQLDYLFKVVTPKGRDAYSEAEVARAVSTQGCPVTESDVFALRTGQCTTAPSRDFLEGIANFFMVPVAYFSDAAVAKRMSEDLEMLSALRSVGAREVAVRALFGLDEDACRALVPVIQQLGQAGPRQRM
ncbi:helix-turn-helix domain-containing protein [Streptomyces sp. NPDC005931]|uniref:helix-turn-helix domain-containing protein n=1 Tax=Streptomyces sp. NPDC005931 TaxID=3364737 RepID=UPI0036C28E28